MRDCRNVLHARLATTRKKQKHNCGGTSERVRANFQGVGNPQNGREPLRLYHAEKARDQPARKPKRENLPAAALLPQNDEGQRRNQEQVSYVRSAEDSRQVSY
jgi:hypothetical protein